MKQIAGIDTAGETAPIKKVTVLMGSPHKGGATYSGSCKLLEGLEAFGDVRGEIVTLSDYDIGVCRGCKTCFNRGEEHCPLKDDRDALIEKMMDSDAVVFASPNYSWLVRVRLLLPDTPRTAQEGRRGALRLGWGPHVPGRR